MQELPKTLNYKLAAKLLSVHEKTILRKFRIADASVTPDVSVGALKKHFGIQPSYISDFLNGSDRAVDTPTVAEYLGTNAERFAILQPGLLTPVAKWPNATRYSAKRLGMMEGTQPPVHEVRMVPA